MDVLDGKAMSQIMDRAIGTAFVTVKPARRTVEAQRSKVDNHLPFTLATVAVKGRQLGRGTRPFPSTGG